MSNLLKDVLFNTSVGVTKKLTICQRYARGVVTGILSLLVHQGMQIKDAAELIKTQLPADYDPESMPELMSDTEACILDLVDKDGPVISGESRERVDNEYLELIQIFMPRPIFDLQDVRKAKEALRQARSVPGGQRSFATNAYVNLLEDLLKQYQTDKLEEFKIGGRYLDKDVFNHLLTVGCFDPEEVYIRMGITEKYADAVLRGKQSLTREDISALCVIYKVSAAIFDHSDKLGFISGRFVVNEHHNGFDLKDRTTGKTHWLSDGVDCVGRIDFDGEEYTLSPGAVGFTRLWEEQLNADEYETLRAYFPATYEQEYDIDTDESNESDDAA